MTSTTTTQAALNGFRSGFPGASYVISSERAPGSLSEVHTATVTYGRVVESGYGSTQDEALEAAFSAIRRQF